MRRLTPVFLFVCSSVCLFCVHVCVCLFCFSPGIYSIRYFFLYLEKTRMYWTILMKLENAGCCCCMWDLPVPNQHLTHPLHYLDKLHIFTFISVKMKQNKVDNSFHLCSAVSLPRDALYPFQTK